MSRTWRIPAQRRALSYSILIIALALFATPCASAQPPADPPNPLYMQARDRITRFIDDEQRVTLRGNLHPMATARNDAGAVPADYRMERMLLTLLPEPAQQDALNQFVEAQHNPDSPFFHQWLTPEQFAERFSVSESDTEQIVGWLQGHGMEVEEVTAGRRSIIFSGNSGQVQEAFHTAIHAFKVGAQLHHANVKEPEIPAALIQVVGGVVSLHDFHSEPLHAFAKKASPELSSGGAYYLAPADFATIYDLAPLYQQSITGSGQSVAIVGRTNINVSDVRQFRSSFGLPANDPQIILNGPDPGIVSSGEETEADLDVEWSGAVAKNAAIKFVVSKSTSSSDGVDLSAQYIVNHNLAPVMSTSFGLCEAWLGSSGNNFLNSLWQQAVAQGITVFVSSGDNGAAGCDSSSAATAKNGRAVNGLCSTPYSVCVGGTQFNDRTNASLYWAPSNASGTQASALSYIPEVVWNESGSSGLWASGGGASTIYAKPTWQTGAGVPADGKRDVPDVSLTAAGHDGYLIVQSGGLYVVGGTSAASPSFAGVMALVVQGTAARQGNANLIFYPLAAKEKTGGAAVFHDITSGTNSVPGQTGFAATAGYDQATGLGSVDASLLVGHWADGGVKTLPGTFILASSATSINVVDGSSGTLTLTITPNSTFSAAVTLSVAGLPSGVSAQLLPSSVIAAPGAGSIPLMLAALSNVPPKAYPITVSATGGGVTQKQSLTLNVTGFSFTPTATSVTLTSAAKGSLSFTSAALAGFSSSLALSVSGLPSGITGSFSPQTIASPGNGTSTLTLTKGSGAVAGTSHFTVTAVGSSLTQTTSVALTVK